MATETLPAAVDRQLLWRDISCEIGDLARTMIHSIINPNQYGELNSQVAALRTLCSRIEDLSSMLTVIAEIADDVAPNMVQRITSEFAGVHHGC